MGDAATFMEHGLSLWGAFLKEKGHFINLIQALNRPHWADSFTISKIKQYFLTKQKKQSDNCICKFNLNMSI